MSLKSSDGLGCAGISAALLEPRTSRQTDMPALSACALVPPTAARRLHAERLGALACPAGIGCEILRVFEGKVRYVYPCAAASESGLACLITPAVVHLDLYHSHQRGCAWTAPVAAEARLTRPKVCLASWWNHLAAVDPAHGMPHK